MSKNYQYDYVGDFSEGLASVCRDGKWGFIDTSGREVVPCRYDDVFDFQEGMARVETDGKWGYIDKTGREVIPCIYEQAYDFSDGLAKVYLEKRFFIDKNGKEVLTAGRDWDVFKEGLARITRDGKTGFVDKAGNEVIPCKYDGASMFCEGMANVCEEHLLPEGEQSDEIDYYTTVGFIDKTGREVVPCKYDFAGDFHEGLAKVSLDGKSGFIDKSGMEVIPLQYDDVRDFSDGLAQVAVGEDSFFIDKSGQKVFSFAERGIVGAWDFSEGLAVAVFEPNGKRGYIDKTGKLMIPCHYFEAHDFHDGRARISDGHGRMYFIDRTGREILMTRRSRQQSSWRELGRRLSGFSTGHSGWSRPAGSRLPMTTV